MRRLVLWRCSVTDPDLIEGHYVSPAAGDRRVRPAIESIPATGGRGSARRPADHVPRVVV